MKGQILKNKKYILTIIAVLLIMVIGFSYGYFATINEGTDPSEIYITTESGNKLVFTQGNELTIRATEENFAQGGANLETETVTKATLYANEENTEVQENYNVYFSVVENTYGYTTEEKKPELLLNVTSPEGIEIDTLTDLNYVTVIDAVTKEEVSGYDITDFDGIVNFATGQEIKSTDKESGTVQEWKVKLTYINLDTNQGSNLNKKIDADVILTQDDLIEEQGPQIAFTSNFVPTEHGWTNQDVKYTVSITDTDNVGIASTKYCVDEKICTPTEEYTGTEINVSEEGEVLVCVEVIDVNSNRKVECSTKSKIDKTAPEVGEIVLKGTEGNDLYYTSNVEVEVTNGTDILSGHDTTTANVQSITEDTTSQEVIITTRDKAGNSASKSIVVKVDKTAPVITGAENKVLAKDEYINLLENVRCTDAGSEEGYCKLEVSPEKIDTSEIGSYEVKYTAEDFAGNVAEKTITVVVGDDYPIIEFDYEEGAVNSNGWSKEDATVNVTITDSQNYDIEVKKYCISDKECKPETTMTTNAIEVNKNGTNVVCVLAENENNKETVRCTKELKIDKTMPTVGEIILEGTQGDNGWYTSDVKVSYKGAVDDVSDVSVTLSHSFVTIEGSTTVTLTVTDAAGNVTTTSKVVKIDKTAPVISTSNIILSGEQKDASSGWYTGNVTITKTNGTDAHSGIKSAVLSHSSITSNTTVSGTTVTLTVTDNAGNVATTSKIVKLDKTAPTAGNISVKSGTLGDNGWYKTNVTLEATGGSDALSGFKSNTLSTTSVTTEGSTVVTLTTRDVAGNTSQKTLTIKKDSVVPTKPTFVMKKETSSGVELDHSSTEWRNYSIYRTAFVSADTTSKVARYQYSSNCSTNILAHTNTGNATYSNNMNSAYCVRSVDNAGNVSPWSDKMYLKIDKTDPSVPITEFARDIEGTQIITDITSDIWRNYNFYRVSTTSTDTGGSGIAGYQASVDCSTGVNNFGATLSYTTEVSNSFCIRSVDNAGNTSEWSDRIYTQIDKTAPVPGSITLSGTKGVEDWYRSTVTATKGTASTDAGGSGIKTDVVSPASVTADGSNNIVKRTVTDNAGNVAETSVIVKKDTVKPVVTADNIIVTGTTGTNGWYTSNVTITASGYSDALSGVQSAVLSHSSITTETSGTTVTLTVTDKAGNVSTASKIVKIDKTTPSVPTVNFSTSSTGSPAITNMTSSIWRNYNVYRTSIVGTDSRSGIARYESSTTCNESNVTTISQTQSYTSNINTSYCVRSVDNAGRKSAWSSRIYVKIDKTVPSEPAFTLKNGTSSGAVLDHESTVWRNHNIYKSAVTSTDSGGSGLLRYEYSTNCSTSVTTYTATAAATYSSNMNTGYCIRSVDNANNVSAWSEKMNLKIDKTDPVPGSITLSGTKGVENWYRSTVTASKGTASTDSGGSGIKTDVVSPASITADGSNNIVKRTVTDNAGNVAETSVIVKKDTVKPVVTAANIIVTGTLVNGWYTSNVTITASGYSDALSGVQSAVLSHSSITSETNGTTVTLTVTDKAGNVSTASKIVKIDKANPTTPTYTITRDSLTGTVITNTSSWRNYSIYLKNITSTDSGSGVASYQYSTNCTGTVTGTSTSSSTYSYTGNSYNTSYCWRAVDNAGRTSGWSERFYVKIDKIVPSTPTFTLKNGTSSGAVLDHESTEWRNYNIYKSAVTSTDTGGSGLLRYEYSTNCSTSVTTYTATAAATYSSNMNTGYCIRSVDNANNVSPWSEKMNLKIDQTDPVPGTIVLSGTEGVEDWYRSTVTASKGTASTDSGGSGIKTDVVSPASITADGSNNIVKRTVTDNAGNVAETSVIVKKDTVKPVVTAANIIVTGTLVNGWYTSNVTITASGYSDALSGVQSAVLSHSSITSETNGTTVTLTVTDKAGNVSTASKIVKIDKTAPSIPTVNFSTSSTGTPAITNMTTDMWRNYSLYRTSIVGTDSRSGIARYESSTTCNESNVTTMSQTQSYTSNINTSYCVRSVDNVGYKSAWSSRIYVKIDTTAPVAATINVSGTTGDNNWYITNIGISATGGSDTLSGFESNTLNTSSITSDTSGYTIVVTTRDKAGNTKTSTKTVKRDATPPTKPTITALLLPDKTTYTSDSLTYQDVSIILDSTDAMSGISHFLEGVPYTPTGSFIGIPFEETDTIYTQKVYTTTADSGTYYYKAVDQAGNQSAQGDSLFNPYATYKINIKEELSSYLPDKHTTAQGLYEHELSLTNGAADYNFRYSGSSSVVDENYICFGSDTTPCPSANLYRIIGFYEHYGTYVTKLIQQNKSANSMVMNSSGEIAYNVSTVFNYLHNTVYNGYTTTHKNLVQNIGWYQGGSPWNESQIAYDYYREDILTPEEAIITANMGLINIHDYAYAGAQSTWTTPLFSYNTVVSQNWMYNEGEQHWTISHIVNRPHISYHYMFDGGKISVVQNNWDYYVRASVYLKSTTKIASGSGTASNPFRVY